VYSLNTSPFEVLLALAFGLFGYWLLRHDFEPAPLLLGFILGPLMEENLRKAMLIARGDVFEIVTRPITGGLLLISLALLVIAVLPTIRRRREAVFTE
jgi:putative tricarboxylic transport membrane protein